MDGATIGAILAAGKSGSGVIASHARARQAAQDARDARDRVTAATIPEIYAMLGLGTLATGTASGQVAAFETNIDLPIKDLHVSIEPVQGLHGYDHPWPGGGGVNVLDPKIKFTAGSYYGMTCSTNDGYTFSLSGTATSSGNLVTSHGDNIVLPAGTYTSIGATFSTYKADGSWYTNRRSGVWTADEPFYVRTAYIEIVSGRTYNNETRIIALAKGSVDINSWTPYSNICPITGWTGVTLVRSPTLDAQDGSTYDLSFGSAGTVYGGTLDVISGELVVDRAVIASYAGETLPDTWISDRDVYADGATPTTGAQVVYRLATPQTYHLTPLQVRTLIGLNNLWADTGETNVTYYRKE